MRKLSWLLVLLATACPAPVKVVCGDAVTAESEACDDGNASDGDGCSASCAIEPGHVCGDGAMAGAEACDDGNVAAADGCSASCTVETGFTCAGTPSVCAARCGDGLTAGPEGCDDGNTVASDGCGVSCAVEPGYSCAGTPSVCAAGCGDGSVSGPEACDDANLTSGDGCSAACGLDVGFTCSGQPSQCASVCGDGRVVTGEGCDDGNSASGDGCASCAVEPGFTCAGAPSQCQTGCGDGSIAGLETCDDGNATAGDGCSACQIDPGFVCAGMPSTCSTTCGDGQWGGPETCDDGNTAAGDGCNGACLLEPGYACVGAPSVCAPRCGDSIIVLPEACDDGNFVASDGCNASCQPENGWTCAGSPSVCATRCGDGVRAGGEACDDGNLVRFDGCSATCRVDLFDEVEPNGTLPQANGPFPVDSAIRASIRPLADDVDLFNFTLTTTTDLTIETFDETGPGRCFNLDTVVTLSGAVVIGDDDDSGLERCSRLSARRLPPGNYVVEVRAYAAYRQLPEYRLVVTADAQCGDMRVQGSEACDGTANCRSTCTRVPTCGDGFVDGVERCDDGNVTNSDGCSASCDFELRTEVEPNGASAQASGPFTVDALWGGAITPAGDRDVFAITLAHTADLRIDTYDDSGAASCSGIDTVVTLLAADGTTVLLTRDQGGLGNCGAIDPSRDPSARQLAAGTYYVRINEFLDDGVISGYRVRVTQSSRCENGVVEGFEECDGAAGCALSCSRVPACGDGFIDAPEACDDGNTNAGDGCSVTCTSESVVEVEPNNTTGQAGAALAPFAQVRGAISPATDLDFYAVTIPVVADLVVETFDPTGVTSCSGIDTTLTLLAPNGTTVLLTKTGGGPGSCAGIDPKTDLAARQLAPGTYFVRVEDAGQNTVIPAYVMRVRFESRCGNSVLEGYEQCDGTTGCTATCRAMETCGNGFVEGAETCDDTNMNAGDGCSATCGIERLEVEPNDTTAAVTSAMPIPIDGWAQGAITAGDVDTWRVVVASARVVQLETFDGASSGCGISTTLKLLDSSGVVLLSDDNSGINGCSAITALLPAGTYFAQVQARTAAATIGQYLLAVRGFVDRGSEGEPNELRSSATMLTGSSIVVLGSHLSNLDVDVFGITAPGGRSLRVELIEGGAETCESTGIDSYVTVFTASGLALGWDDDSGRGLCSLIDGTGAAAVSPWASRLASGTYYLQVEAAPFAQMASDQRGQFDYRLVISIR